MLNMSKLVSRLKRDTGLAFISLPIDNFDDRIVEVIQDTTIPTFSEFFPRKVEVDFDLSLAECIQSNFNHAIYILPPINQSRFTSIEKVYPNDLSVNAEYMDPVYNFSLATYGEMMLAQAEADLISFASPPFTFNYEYPGTLHLYNISSIGYKLKINGMMEHSQNLSTIKPTMVSSFYDLALLDFKCFLYQNLKHFDQIPTAYGNINLRIEDYGNAEAERRDLIERYRDTFHLDRDQTYYI